MQKLPTEVLNLRLIVEPLPRKEQEINGIIIAASANADLSEGLVVACDSATNVKVGETVLYPSGSGVGQVFNNKSCLWIHVNDVWAVV